MRGTIEYLKIKNTNINDPTTNDHTLDSILGIFYIIIGSITFIGLLLVIIIHFKYDKYKKEIFTILLATIIIELMLSVHQVFNGYLLLFSVSNQTLCQLNNYLNSSTFFTYLMYNNFLLIFILLNKLPNKNQKTKLRENKIERRNHRKKIFITIHSLAIISSLILSILFFICAYENSQESQCIINNFGNNENIYSFSLPAIIFFLLSLIFVFFQIFNFRQNKFPPLKRYPLYCIITSILWLVAYFKYLSTDNFFNAVSCSAELLALITIFYFRISSGYIQIVLSQGDSNNKLVQAILIFFRLDTPADIENYVRRKTIHLEAQVHLAK
jgi:hypothetical protein